MILQYVLPYRIRQSKLKGAKEGQCQIPILKTCHEIKRKSQYNTQSVIFDYINNKIYVIIVNLRQHLLHLHWYCQHSTSQN